ncbi:MAG TPA: maleylpyruvate isomerase family mycothiol-dependent enzyme [Acidimicrobiales bacterium]
MGLDHETQVDAVAREAGALVDAVAAGPLDARVPTCPDFAVDDLARHVGQFCGFWTHVLLEATGRPPSPFDDPDDLGDPAAGGAHRADWLRPIVDHLVDALRSTPPDTPTWTWHPTRRTARFVARRCSHELAVHRVDAQLARGAAEPVEAALAADGIEEIFVLLENPVRSPLAPDGAAGRTIHLHGTDHEPAEWLLTLDDSATAVTVERTHAKGDLALRGPVGDLEMLLYQRPTVGEVARFGDEAVLAAFHHRFTFVSGRR